MPTTSSSPDPLPSAHAPNAAGGRSVQLDYGRGRPRRRIRRHHLVVAVLLVGCIAGSWLLGRSARDRTQSLLYQRQAARHVEPANLVVFEPNAITAQALIDAGTHISLSGSSAAPAVIREPESLALLRSSAALETVGALIFLHELTTPSGARRIVAVQFLPHYLDGRFLPAAGLVAHVFEPGGFLSDPKLLGRSHARLLVPADEPEDVQSPLAPPPATARHLPGIGSRINCLTTGGLDELRWFAGQPDSLDATHFTIDYEMGGMRGTIDGYLSDDGRHVRMHTRPSFSHGAPTHGLTQIAWQARSLR